MKLLIQRVNSVSVIINDKIHSKISKGMLIYIGISKEFSEEKITKAIKKILNLRIWPSEKKGFDLNIKEISGEIMIISQFTLHANCKKGNKPNFKDSKNYNEAKNIYDKFIKELKKETNLTIKTGKFGSHMKIISENDGPINLIIDF